MSSSMYVKSIKADGPTFVTVGASKTKQLVTKPAAPVPVDGRGLFRMDFYLGLVSVTTSIKAGMEHSNGHNVWSATKESTVNTNTGTSISSQSGGVFTTGSGHGLSVGQAVVFGGTTVPAGIEVGKSYKVDSVPSSTTFTVVEYSSNKIPTITSAGSSAVVVPVVQVPVCFVDTVSGDQTYLPLQNTVRGYITTGTSDSCQVVDVKITPGL